MTIVKQQMKRAVEIVIIFLILFVGNGNHNVRVRQASENHGFLMASQPVTVATGLGILDDLMNYDPKETMSCIQFHFQERPLLHHGNLGPDEDLVHRFHPNPLLIDRPPPAIS
jgi:hypothetical protein